MRKGGARVESTHPKPNTAKGKTREKGRDGSAEEQAILTFGFAFELFACFINCVIINAVTFAIIVVGTTGLARTRDGPRAPFDVLALGLRVEVVGSAFVISNTRI